MLTDGHDKFRARFPEKRNPFFGAEVFRFEHRDEVLIAELVLIAEMNDVITELTVVYVIHRSRIPLIAEAGNAVYPPVDENAELSFVIPRRRFVIRKRLPVVLEFSLFDHFVDKIKIFVLSHRFLLFKIKVIAK